MIKIVLSDLHLGAGRIREGNLLEDFEQDDELAALLDELAAESEAKGHQVELILNGDIFEFWQAPALADPDAFDPRARYPSRFYLSTREQDARRRMALILRGHPVVVAALAGFMQATPPRRFITIIKGNHDIQLHWPAAQRALRDALGAHGPKEPLLRFEPRRVSRDGIYVEHGNQYADPLNRHPDMEAPYHPLDRTRLRMVPGGPISIRVVNRMERDHYWITSVKPLSALFFFLLRFHWRAGLRLLWFMLPHLPKLLWLHLPMTRSSKALAREIKAIQAEMEGAPGAGEAPAGGEPDLIGLPPFEQVMADQEIADDPLLAHGLLEEHYLHARLRQVARRRAHEEGAQVVVFGHTHVPAFDRLDRRICYVNTGSWTWMLDLGSAPAEAWRRLIRHEDMDDVHYHLTYARIDYDEKGAPRARLLEFPSHSASWRRPLRETLTRGSR
jgi:UDP-2,3-diacylglucosamine pyrophosphatase LpxH